jgi:hypothetical protein
MTNLEKVEKLCAMANISYEEAKIALETSNWDLLDAIIYLEKQGKVHAPTGSGYYSSEKVVDANIVSTQQNNEEKQYYNGKKESSFKTFIKKAWDLCMKLLRKGNQNSFEVLKGNEVKASFPVTVLALLLIFAFWVTIPLLVVGLFFGLRYRFIGTDFANTTINNAMDSAAEAAEDLKKSMNN